MSQSLLEKYPHLISLMEKQENPAKVEEKEKEVPSNKQKAGSSSSSSRRKDIKDRSRGPQPPPPPHVSAEKLAADGLEADEAEWLSFHIKETGWRSNQLGELKSWLEQNKPSKVLRSDGIGWIAVSCRSVSLSIRLVPDIFIIHPQVC